jgi:site-specific DNA recombinase
MSEDPPQPSSIRAVIYCRVSTEDQAKEGFSLSAQEERLKAYCLAKGWTVVRTFIDDGYSGRTDDRPAYREMMETRNEWDVMVVLKMDRIHRNSKNFTLMMEELKLTGKEFTSMQESFDTTTAMGRFVMDIIQRIAQLESEQIGERVYIGMQQKAKEGKGILGFPIPYGYTMENGSLSILNDESTVVRQIFHDCLDGRTMREISKCLNDAGTPTKSGVSKWYPSTVHRILSNPIYCGYLRWEGIIYKGQIEQVIDVSTFQRVQALLHRKNSKYLIKIDEEGPSSVMTA